MKNLALIALALAAQESYVGKTINNVLESNDVSYEVLSKKSGVRETPIFDPNRNLDLTMLTMPDGDKVYFRNCPAKSRAFLYKPKDSRGVYPVENRKLKTPQRLSNLEWKTVLPACNP